MTRPPSMSHLVWHSLSRLPTALRERVLGGEDVRRRSWLPEEDDRESDEDVFDAWRKWRSG